MAGQEFLAHETEITIGGTAIEAIRTITLPTESKGDVEITSNDSQGVRRYLPGLKEGDVLTLECLRKPGAPGQQAMRDNYAAKALVEEFIITLPDDATDDTTTATFTFDGYVNELGGELPQDEDEAGTVSYQVKVDGEVTEAVS